MLKPQQKFSYFSNKNKQDNPRSFFDRIDKDTLLFGLALIAPFILAFLIAHPIVSGDLWALIEPIFFNTVILGCFGIAFGFVLTSHSLIAMSFKRTMPSRERLNKSLFKVCKFAVLAMGYLFYIPLGLTPVSGSIFMLAAFMDVVRSSIKFYRFYQDRVKHITESDLSEKDKNKMECYYDCKFKTLAIKVVSAIAITIIMAAWAFIPGGFFVVGAPALVGMFAVLTMRIFTCHYFRRERNAEIEKINDEASNDLQEKPPLSRRSSRQALRVISANGKMIAELKTSSNGRMSPQMKERIRKSASAPSLAQLERLERARTPSPLKGQG